MPDISFPSITVRVGYTGVGPLEMEELITRPIEQAVSAVAGLDQINSTSSEGNSTVRLNFTWGTDLNEAADEVRTRIDRVRGRLPEDADPPTIFKFDSTSFPIMGIGVEGNFDAVTLREMAQNDLSPRLERVAGVAAVSVDGGLRRQIRVDLSREKITALNLSVDRVVQILRTENQNIPLGEVFEGRPHAAAAQPRPVHRHRRDPQHVGDDARTACRSTCATSPTSATPPRIAASSPASTARRASACGSPSSRAPTPCRSPRASAPRSTASTARCPA